ncbi:NAD(P)H-dependent oxidoreductase [Sphingosinicella sp. LHD-64]|uniref:flavodoxin family protein n=1 Tax=Sphingosinicella sp. LHD-64 TaxID=3072139 RepID=UPI00280E23DA|nr:NAD(P)H-dependent oxidoreductase [Sphingosinicella sp. LHD-64]MDQ8758120.1 NAD(P)H-dependent oxidoreductase [Sphingosinicella sp. LHD-64]
MTLRAIALNCSLKRAGGGETSSTDRMIGLIADALRERGVAFDGTIRIVDHDVKPGVTSDEGDGDTWPEIRRRILACDLLIFGTPIWMGQMSSVAKRVCERMDAFLGETDDAGRMPSFGKVALIAVVGNEDGAHGVTAHLGQALVDVGWTLPPSPACYWVGEAMGKTDFQQLDRVPDKVAGTVAMAAASAAHLAGLLKAQPYPGVTADRKA